MSTNNLASEDSSEDVSGLASIKIQPAELVFSKVAIEVPETKTLTLINTSDDLLAFKVKTTAPKRYCVRPNTGFLPPKEKVEVSVILNLQKDPPKTMDPASKQRDKFQLQSIVVKGLAEGDPAAKPLWDSVGKEGLMKSKLRSYFTVAPSTGAAPTKAKKESSEAKKRSHAEKPSNDASSSEDVATAPAKQAPELTKDVSEPKVITSTPTPAAHGASDELLRLQNEVSDLQAKLRQRPATPTAVKALPTSAQSNAGGLSSQGLIFILIAFLLGIIIAKFML